MSFVREISIQSKGEEASLQINQKCVGGVECVVWDAALVLTKFMEHNQDSFRDKRVLEIGAGTGVCGLAAAALGADVVITDLDPALPLIRENTALNEHLCKGKVSIRELDWCDKGQLHHLRRIWNVESGCQGCVPKSDEKGHFDYILVADCIYYEASLLPLISTLHALCGPNTVVLCCYEMRDIGKPAEVQANFLELARDFFDVSAAEPLELHPEFRCDDIPLVKMRLKHAAHECTKLSVITPVHNAASWLQDCLDSVRNQSIYELYPDVAVELSIFDDASSDNSPSIAAEFVSSLDCLNSGGDSGQNITKENLVVKITRSKFDSPQGVGFAKNEAIRASTGDYLVFLDADDYMHPNRLAKILEHIRSYGPWTIYGSRFDRDPPESTPRLTEWANGLTRDQLFTQIYTSHGPTLATPTWCFSRKLYDYIGGFDQSAPKGIPEDMIFFFSALAAGSDLMKIDEPLLTYRYHQYNASHAVLEETMWNIRVEQFRSKILSKWNSFTIWGAGKEGKRFYRSLPQESRQKVLAFCDVDPKKLQRGFYEYALSDQTPKPRIPIVHFEKAAPPLVICVKLGLTEGNLENNVKSLELEEGIDYFFFG